MPKKPIKKRAPNDCVNCVFGDMQQERYTKIRCNRIPYAKIKFIPYLQCEFHCRVESPIRWRIRMEDDLINGEYIKMDIA